MKILLGSEKQIAWANDIRDKAINGVSVCRIFGINQVIEKAENKIAKKQIEKKGYHIAIIILNMAKKKLIEIENQKNASWFIDNKIYLLNIQSNIEREARKQYFNIKSPAVIGMKLK